MEVSWAPSKSNFSPCSLEDRQRFSKPQYVGSIPARGANFYLSAGQGMATIHILTKRGQPNGMVCENCGKAHDKTMVYTGDRAVWENLPEGFQPCMSRFKKT